MGGSNLLTQLTTEFLVDDKIDHYQSIFKKRAQPGPFFVYVCSFHMTNIAQILL